MYKPPEILDGPVLIEVRAFGIEDCKGFRNYRRFAHFRWREADIWLIGTMVWRNSLQVGRVWLRLPRGRKLLSASLGVRPDFQQSFHVGRPRDRYVEKCDTFVFEGFDDRLVVNIDFVREEDRRLEERFKMFGGAEPSIQRPASGKIV